jgi:C4-dicarboxylate-specific signal transduction histidine kinase
MAAIDLNRAVQDSVDFLMPQMKLSNVEVGLDLAPDLPPVIGDRIRLEQVLLNLLTNARQAMEGSAERRLSVRTFADGDAECPVAVEVRDTGKGFTREERAKLFTPFFTTKKAGHGTGLGLPISKSIIKDHKGRIEADGEAGRGAVFTVRLPAAPPSAPRSDQA